MKLSNFLRFDDSYAGSGLTHGGKLEEEVWNEFASEMMAVVYDRSEFRFFGMLDQGRRRYKTRHLNLLYEGLGILPA